MLECTHIPFLHIKVIDFKRDGQFKFAIVATLLLLKEKNSSPSSVNKLTGAIILAEVFLPVVVVFISSTFSNTLPWLPSVLHILNTQTSATLFCILYTYVGRYAARLLPLKAVLYNFQPFSTSSSFTPALCTTAQPSSPPLSPIPLSPLPFHIHHNFFCLPFSDQSITRHTVSHFYTGH